LLQVPTANNQDGNLDAFRDVRAKVYKGFSLEAVAAPTVRVLNTRTDRLLIFVFALFRLEIFSQTEQ
jgi:hypothetical protein